MGPSMSTSSPATVGMATGGSNDAVGSGAALGDGLDRGGGGGRGGEAVEHRGGREGEFLLLLAALVEALLDAGDRLLEGVEARGDVGRALGSLTGERGDAVGAARARSARSSAVRSARWPPWPPSVRARLALGRFGRRWPAT